MAAPTNAAKREESSCQPGAVHTWHLADIKRKSDFGAVRSEFDAVKQAFREAIRGMIDAMLHLLAKDPGDKPAKKAKIR
jgi:hypothetical protein